MSTYAIIETGSKQYRVEPNQVIEVEKLDLPEKTKEVTLDRILLLSDGKSVQIGSPVVKGAKVICDLLEQFKSKKVISFTYRRRKNSRNIEGHRQPLTRLMVKQIKAA